MDRRVFLTGLLGVAGTAALASALPRQAQAVTGDPLEDLLPPRPDGLPEWEIAEEPAEEGIQIARHGGPHYWRRRRRRRYWRRRRRRARRWRWRRRCYWRYGRRICRRRRYPIWIWLSI